MKEIPMKRKTKKFIRHIYVENCGDFSQAARIFNELGFTVYDDPSSDGDCFIISNRRLTFRDFIPFYVSQAGASASDKEAAKAWAIEAFGDKQNKELDKI